MSYPWIKDSKYGTTPLVTNYLEVTSPNGLYLNSTNSEVLLKNPATNEKLTLSKSSIDFTNAGGNSVVLIDNTKIHLNELVPTTTPFTTDITNSNIILQSQNFISPNTNTLTLQPNLIQHLTPSFNMIIGTGSLQTTSLPVNYTSTINPYICVLGSDGVGYNGDLFCRDITCSLINGYAPTTTGLIWSNFDNAYPNLLNGRYYLTDTTYETWQDITQLFARNMSSGQSASYSWSGINTSAGTFTLQTNGYNFDLYCATFNINGIPYSSGSSSQDLNTTLGYGNNAGFQSIDNVNNINLSTINGSPYPPYPTAPYGLPNVLSIDANANTAINMNSNDINSVNNINVSTINNSPYPPSVSVPQFIYAMPFQSEYVNNGGGSPTLFTSGVFITGGFTYAITWTFWYDGLYHGRGTTEMIQGYGDLFNNFTGSISGQAKSNGYWASATISSNNMCRTSITYTDNNFVINNSDTYYPYIYQSNNIDWSGNVYCSATISRTN
jgi:hypothetical protein